MNRYLALATVMVVSISSPPIEARAHGGATGVVKERMDMMKSMGDALDAISAMMKGEQPYNVEQVRTHARTIAEHGGASLTELFPEGSLDAPTEAQPNIWTDWAKFDELAEQVSVYAAALEDAAANERGQSQGGMMSGGGRNMMMGGRQAGPSPEMLAGMPPDAAFMHVTQSCAACHKVFRKEK